MSSNSSMALMNSVEVDEFVQVQNHQAIMFERFLGDTPCFVCSAVDQLQSLVDLPRVGRSGQRQPQGRARTCAAVSSGASRSQARRQGRGLLAREFAVEHGQRLGRLRRREPHGATAVGVGDVELASIGTTSDRFAWM